MAEEKKELTWEEHFAAGFEGLSKELRERCKAMPPEEFRTHMRAAGKEFLLAFRSLVDEMIAATEEKKRAAKTKV